MLGCRQCQRASLRVPGCKAGRRELLRCFLRAAHGCAGSSGRSLRHLGPGQRDREDSVRKRCMGWHGECGGRRDVKPVTTRLRDVIALAAGDPPPFLNSPP
ncbi:unnamed protein product [Coccothraustes coccothraustes]